MKKQEVFDICMVILSFALAAAVVGWYAVHETDRPCKFVSPYKNTLQHDMHRQMKCEDK